MPKIIADHNIEGHLKVLVRILQTGPWAEIWNEIGVEIVSFDQQEICDTCRIATARILVRS